MYYVENETEEKVDLKQVRAILKKIVAYYGEKRDFSVTFVTDNEIQELNREYREIDAPTDILTFRLDDAPSFPISFEEEDVDFLNNEEMGDIFISLDTMRRNAEEFGVKNEEELSRLLLHGILHALSVCPAGPRLRFLAVECGELFRQLSHPVAFLVFYCHIFPPYAVRFQV